MNYFMNNPRKGWTGSERNQSCYYFTRERIHLRRMESVKAEHSADIKLEEQKLSPKSFSISYPFIPEGELYKGKDKINEGIINECSELFKNQVLLPEKVDFLEVLGTYEITLNKNNIISVLLSLYTYVNMAAHGFTAYSSITANADTGEIYSFEDLFNPKFSYAAAIDEIAREYIKKNNIALLNDFKGIEPNQQFYLTSDSLIVYYPVYKYTPYYYGLFKIEIPYNKISNLITPVSPITEFI
ncbi:RsiV family protein [Clostridium polynesiense]|uniref:RsiV family protein n=1 Tax=Clostridium polynesiense TaxID=1325933 RepID=UPI000AC46EFD|nr:RsiV family protein [Clostridium polynesiense]